MQQLQSEEMDSMDPGEQQILVKYFANKAKNKNSGP